MFFLPVVLRYRSLSSPIRACDSCAVAGAAGGGPRPSGCGDRARGPQAQEVAPASLPSPRRWPGPALSLLGDAPGDPGLPPSPSSHALPPFGVLGSTEVC